jgi:hypothetical protein
LDLSRDSPFTSVRAAQYPQGPMVPLAGVDTSPPLHVLTTIGGVLIKTSYDV